MAALGNLSHLFKLLDDDSEVEREAVQRQLAEMRHELPKRLHELERPLTEEEERLVAQLLDMPRREELEETWMRWLAEWLFGGRGHAVRFRGNSRDYYAPQNSNLFWVMDTGLGNPISLCCLYRLIGSRFGLTIEGCNFPGHFLARVVEADGQVWLVDCFNRGRFMLASDVAKHHPAANPGMEDLVRSAAPVDAVLMRFLRNLDDSYDRLGYMPERQLIRRLALRLMEDS